MIEAMLLISAGLAWLAFMLAINICYSGWYSLLVAVIVFAATFIASYFEFYTLLVSIAALLMLILLILTIAKSIKKRKYTAEKQPSTKKNLFIYGIIIAIVAIVIVVNLYEGSDLTPVAEPRSGEILSGTEFYNESEITITAPRGEACVVKLKTPSGVERLSFYVRAGDTVTVGVPCEYLQIYFASGHTWYGHKHLFGEYTDYAMDDEILDFAEYTWEYTLHPVGDGNFSQTPIDEDEF